MILIFVNFNKYFPIFKQGCQIYTLLFYRILIRWNFHLVCGKTAQENVVNHVMHNVLPYLSEHKTCVLYKLYILYGECDHNPFFGKSEWRWTSDSDFVDLVSEHVDPIHGFSIPLLCLSKMQFNSVTRLSFGIQCNDWWLSTK
jgi:hypothetical protein